MLVITRGSVMPTAKVWPKFKSSFTKVDVYTKVLLIAEKEKTTLSCCLVRLSLSRCVVLNMELRFKNVHQQKILTQSQKVKRGCHICNSCTKIYPSAMSLERTESNNNPTLLKTHSLSAAALAAPLIWNEFFSPYSNQLFLYII